MLSCSWFLINNSFKNFIFRLELKTIIKNNPLRAKRNVIVLYRLIIWYNCKSLISSTIIFFVSFRIKTKKTIQSTIVTIIKKPKKASGIIIAAKLFFFVINKKIKKEANESKKVTK